MESAILAGSVTAREAPRVKPGIPRGADESGG